MLDTQKLFNTRTAKTIRFKRENTHREFSFYLIQHLVFGTEGNVIDFQAKECENTSKVIY